MDAATHAIHVRLLRARLARVMAGIVLILTAIAMIVGAMVSSLGLYILVIGWGISLLMMMLGRLWAAALKPQCPEDMLARWGLRLPMLGLALVMPMTLHAVVTVLIGKVTPMEFSGWIQLSSVIVGQAYIVLGWLVYQDANRIVNDVDAIPWTQRAWAVLWKTSAASCVPSIILLGVPPILTFMTGSVFIPAMYFIAYRIQAWEQACQDWLTLARRINVEAANVQPYTLPTLNGVFDGVRLEFSGWRTMTGSMVLNLEAALGCSALMHLNISADPNDPAQIRLGEPVADSVLRISSSCSTTASHLLERLGDEECYAALMAVVHGLGGRIALGRIRLRLEATSMAPLWSALPLVIDLAQLLRAPPEHLTPVSPVLSPPQPLRQASPAG